LNPVNSDVVFLQEENGQLKYFIINANNTLTLNITYNWNSTTWRGEVTWNRKGDIFIALGQNRLGAVSFDLATLSVISFRVNPFQDSSVRFRGILFITDTILLVSNI
jgi:hypothetical protein